jgi:hypothetical protein
MKIQTALFSKILFVFTVAFFTTACVIFGVKFLTIHPSETFLTPNAFSSMLYWIMSFIAAIWYVYIYGFPKTLLRVDAPGEKTYFFLLSIFLPLLIGMGIGFVLYYTLFGLSVLFIATFGYLVAVLLVAGIFYMVRLLINLHFKPKELKPFLQNVVIWLSLAVSFGLLVVALFVLPLCGGE